MLQINKNVRIVNNDGLNYCPEKRVIAPDVIHGKPNKNAGKESWKHMGYYPSLKLAYWQQEVRYSI
jgi:hypothetical protein